MLLTFDGTIAEHRFPDIGPEVPGAFKWMKEFQTAGAKLILWTMRSDSPSRGLTLTEAVQFCKKNDIEFFGINTNPEQTTWTSSPKAYANIYIDDAMACCPLRPSMRYSRPFVDWDIVGPWVMNQINLRSTGDD